MNKGAVFFDRDGIVNQRIFGDYVKALSDFVFIEDFFETFRIVKNHNLLSFIITNQQGIGKGLMTAEELHSIHHFMNQKLIQKTGFTFDEIFFCPSLESDNDYYRKPNPGMILEAIEKYNLTKEKCIIIGDSESDIIAGIKAGIQTIYISTVKMQNDIIPNYSFINMNELNQNLHKILTLLKEK
jgi:histidinol-phosphate phosphatase family protein